LHNDSRHEGKVEAIQLLRFGAATAVALPHMAFAFANHIGPGLGLGPDLLNSANHASQLAVAVFFVLSGYVMVISSRQLFGRPQARRLFWSRRCIRILPPYWLASGLLAVVLLAIGEQVDLKALGVSLALVPVSSATFAGRPEFFLWPGWTLLYEMVFYLTFGLALTAGKWRTAITTLVLIAALVVAGQWVAPHTPWLFSLTRPILLIFLGGMGLALLRESGWTVPPLLRWLAALLAIVAWQAIPAPADAVGLGMGYVVWVGTPALLLAVALLGGELRLPWAPAINRLGDWSYALYLLHVPLAHAWINLFPLRFGAWVFLLSLVVVTYAASFLAFQYVERPMTRRLNALLAPRPSPRPSSGPQS
jgi:peptidoglycan/LPS O-acetylase OafA/YrhL